MSSRSFVLAFVMIASNTLVVAWLQACCRPRTLEQVEYPCFTEADNSVTCTIYWSTWRAERGNAYVWLAGLVAKGSAARIDVKWKAAPTNGPDMNSGRAINQVEGDMGWCSVVTTLTDFEKSSYECNVGRVFVSHDEVLTLRALLPSDVAPRDSGCVLRAEGEFDSDILERDSLNSLVINGLTAVACGPTLLLGIFWLAAARRRVRAGAAPPE